MAGLAALMTRKKRDRRRELELRQHMQDSGSIAELTGKEAEEVMQRKAAHETIKKMLMGKELLHQKSKSFDALSQMSYNDNDDGSSKNGLGNAYSAIYIGLILMCIGAVITFVGLGEKGFKTLQLKLIGPVLALIGFTCITIKIIHCTFPQLFQYPAFIKKRKLADASDKSNLMEKGATQNGHLSNPSTKSSPQFVSPRVTLQSSKKPPSNRPRSTIPNYIEDSSEDEDDFDPGRSRPHSNRYNSVEANNHNHTSRSEHRRPPPDFHSQENNDANKVKPNIVQSAVVQPISEPQAPNKPQSSDKQQQKGEILLTPKALML